MNPYIARLMQEVENRADVSDGAAESIVRGILGAMLDVPKEQRRYAYDKMSADTPVESFANMIEWALQQ